MLHKAVLWLGHVMVATGMITLLCGADAPGWVRIYSPAFSVSAVVEGAKIDQIFHEIVDSIRQTAVIDMDDPSTAYAVKQFGHDEKMMYFIGYGFIDSKGVKFHPTLSKPSKVYAGPPVILISIGYGKEPIARDQLEAKADELVQELKGLCERAGAACEVESSLVPLLPSSPWAGGRRP